MYSPSTIFVCVCVCVCEGMDSLEAYKGYYGDHHGNQGDGYTHSTNDLQGQPHKRTSSLNIEDIDVQYHYIINASISYCTCEATNCECSLHSCLDCTAALAPPTSHTLICPHRSITSHPITVYRGLSVSKLHAFQPPRMTENEVSKVTECQ